MNSRKILTVGLTIAALGIAALAPSSAAARDASGRLHFHPFTFVDAPLVASSDDVDRVVCQVHQVSTPQGVRLIQACD